METVFSEKDLAYILNRGNSIDKIMQQLYYFKNGISKMNLQKSATVGDGIHLFSENEKKELIAFFDENLNGYTLEKFVPASGAATRMFQFLNEFLNRFNPEKDTLNSYINKYNDTLLSIFIVGLRNFPFHPILKELTKRNFPDYATYSRDKKVYVIIKTLLDSSGLNYSSNPKGILPFHIRNQRVFTPVDEHVFESEFLKNKNGQSKIHFTVTPDFEQDFVDILQNYDWVDYSFSYQDQTSDTIAVNSDNTPFRLENNELFFRPGGHGALIENLNQLQSDIIFIKNIDNVSFNALGLIVENKKILGGLLLKLQKQIFNYIQQLESLDLTNELIQEIKLFVESKLSFPLVDEFELFQIEYKRDYLYKILNRPIRVCGMVKNEGEPGGGPFWVKDEKGRMTLQIVESSQIDLSNEQQLRILKNATHFNPVDIVCGIKNYKGEKFDLSQFVDPSAAFITEKTKLGKPIKAFELPGLWNGAMAKWITIFVEVPLETFNPVKTVNDLLKPMHQPIGTDIFSV